MAAKTLPEFLSDRISPDQLKLLKLLDSYHDFAGERGNKESVVELDKLFLETFIPSKKRTEDTLNKEVNTYLKSQGMGSTASNYFERETEAAYERLLDSKVLYGTPQSGTICTNITYTQMYAMTEANIVQLSITTDVIQLIADYAFLNIHNTPVKKSEAYTIVATNYLLWLFHGKKSESKPSKVVGFSFDAADNIKGLLDPLNDYSKMFVTQQVLTPQNILDSAPTSIKIFSGLLNDKGTLTSRIDYDFSLNKQYSNQLTQDIGQFIIEKGTYNQDNIHGFQWKFKPKEGDAVPFVVSDNYNIGPSLPYLASLIACAGKCGDKLERLKGVNHMIQPAPIIKKYNEAECIRFFFDIKRMGDHEQANAVWAKNMTKTKCVFVTGDILSGLYSRIIGNPTVYINKCGVKDYNNEGADLGCKSFFSYRGTPLEEPTEEEKNRRQLQYSINVLNNILVTYTQFANATSSIRDLQENIETFSKDFAYANKNIQPTLTELKTNLLKRKAEDIYSHLKSITDIRGLIKLSFKTHCEAVRQSAIEKKLINKEDNIRREGFQMILNAVVPNTIVKAMMEELKTVLDTLTQDFDTIRDFLKDFNNVMSLNSEGTPIFSIRNLFINKTKAESKLSFIRFDEEEFSTIISFVSKFVNSRGGRGSDTSDSLKSKIIDTVSYYFSSFYNKDVSTMLKENVEKAIREQKPGEDMAVIISAALMAKLGGTRTEVMTITDTQEAPTISKPPITMPLAFPGKGQSPIIGVAANLQTVYEALTKVAKKFINTHSEHIRLLPGADGNFSTEAEEEEKPLTPEERRQIQLKALQKRSPQKGGEFTAGAGYLYTDYNYWYQRELMLSTLNQVKGICSYSKNDESLHTIISDKWLYLDNLLSANGPVDLSPVNGWPEDIRTAYYYQEITLYASYPIKCKAELAKFVEFMKTEAKDTIDTTIGTFTAGNKYKAIIDGRITNMNNELASIRYTLFAEYLNREVRNILEDKVKSANGRFDWVSMQHSMTVCKSMYVSLPIEPAPQKINTFLKSIDTYIITSRDAGKQKSPPVKDMEDIVSVLKTKAVEYKAAITVIKAETELREADEKLEKAEEEEMIEASKPPSTLAKSSSGEKRKEPVKALAPANEEEETAEEKEAKTQPQKKPKRRTRKLRRERN